MKKENFITLVMGTVGGLIFALGMCMCLITEWNTFNQGVVFGAIGIVILLAMLAVRRKMLGKPPVQLSAKAVGTIIFGVFAALVFGVGMCMTMVWEGMMIYGILVGIAGIVMLLCLIPLCKGLK